MADALTADLQTTPARRPGAITLARHGEPALSRDVKLTARGYREFWAKYEEMGLLPGQTPPVALMNEIATAGAVISSVRIRSIESALALCEGRAFVRDATFIEAPLPPPNWPSFIKLAPSTWGFIARFWWWFFNHHAGQESRGQAEIRADVATDLIEGLAADGTDVVVVAHGFFNFMIGRALRRRGWKMTANQGWKYWSTRRYERG